MVTSITLDPANTQLATDSDLNTKLNSDSAAAAFSPQAVYYANDLCTKDGVLYRCTATSHTGQWIDGDFAVTNMTAPDATLDITSSGRLRVVGADGTVLWEQGRKLVTLLLKELGTSVYGITPPNNAVSYYEFSDESSPTRTLVMPNISQGEFEDSFSVYVRNTNPANTGYTLTLAFDATKLDTEFAIAMDPNVDPTTALTFEEGEMAELRFTRMPFLHTISSITMPVWKLERHDIDIVESGT